MSGRHRTTSPSALEYMKPRLILAGILLGALAMASGWPL